MAHFFYLCSLKWSININNIIESIQRKYKFTPLMSLAVIDSEVFIYSCPYFVCLFGVKAPFSTLWIHWCSSRLGDRTDFYQLCGQSVYDYGHDTKMFVFVSSSTKAYVKYSMDIKWEDFYQEWVLGVNGQWHRWLRMLYSLAIWEVERASL